MPVTESNSLAQLIHQALYMAKHIISKWSKYKKFLKHITEVDAHLPWQFSEEYSLQFGENFEYIS